MVRRYTIMAIFYINPPTVTGITETDLSTSVQDLIDQGYSLPDITVLFSSRRNNTYNIIDQSLFLERLGSPYKLFYTRPLPNWSLPINQLQYLTNRKITLITDIVYNKYQTEPSGSIAEELETDIDNYGYGLLTTDDRLSPYFEYMRAARYAE